MENKTINIKNFDIRDFGDNTYSIVCNKNIKNKIVMFESNSLINLNIKEAKKSLRKVKRKYKKENFEIKSPDWLLIGVK